MKRGDAETRTRANDRGLRPDFASPPLNDANDWLLWQLADSAFPTGGFAHSGGLEAVWQHREITSGEDLFQLLAVALEQMGNSTLLFVVAAYQGTPPFAELDGLCEAFTSNHVANRASRLQGQALLASAERSFATEALKQFRASVLEQRLPAHLAPVFGAIGRVLGLEQSATIRLSCLPTARLDIGLSGWGSWVLWEDSRFNIGSPRTQNESRRTAEAVRLSMLRKPRPSSTCFRQRRTGSIHDYFKAENSLNWLFSFEYKRRSRIRLLCSCSCSCSCSCFEPVESKSKSIEV
jgi:hypothetical protein